MGDLKKSIARNTLLNFAGYFWTTLLGFLLTPLLVHFVGLKDFGLYIFLTSAAGWLWILDLGASTALVCFLSRYAAAGNEERFADCLSTTLALKIAVGLLVGTACLLAGTPLARNLDPQDPSHAFLTLQLVGWGYAVTNLSSAYNAALSARQRMDIPVRLGLWISLPSSATAAILLILGKGVAGFAASNLAFALLYLLLVRHSTIRTSPGGGVYPRRLRLRELAPLLSFSLKNAGSRLVNTFFLSADRLTLGNNLSSLSLYQIGASLVRKIQDVTALVASASLPAMSDLQAREDRARINLLFQRGMKYLTMVGLPLTILVVVFTEELLVLWMGVTFPESAKVLRLLAAGYFLRAMAEMAAPLGAAINRPGLQLQASLAALAATLIAYFLWGRHHDLAGLAASVSAGYGLLGVLLIALVLREMKEALFFPPRLLAKPFLATLCSSALTCLPAKWLSLSQGWVRDRLGAALFLAVAAAGTAAAYALTLKTFQVLDRQDWELISLILRKGHPSSETVAEPPPGPSL